VKNYSAERLHQAGFFLEIELDERVPDAAIYGTLPISSCGHFQVGQESRSYRPIKMPAGACSLSG